MNNQVKTLSNKDADKEGHIAYSIADALFRVVIGPLFSGGVKVRKPHLRN